VLETHDDASTPDPRLSNLEERWRQHARWILAATVFALLVFVVVGALVFAPSADAGGSCGGG
jgi:hypothetical protein